MPQVHLIRTKVTEYDIIGNSSSGIVSFEGTPGEYTFELTVLDNYGASTTVTKTVKIEPEPNQAPIVDLEIRQGTGTN